MKSLNKFDEFRLARKLSFFNRFVQVVLLVTLIIGVNLFAIKFTVRWDITQDRSNSLSPETVAHFQQISDDFSIFVAVNDKLQLPGGRYVMQDIEPMFDQYLHVANRLGMDDFHLEYINIYRDREKVLQLKESFEFDQENVILVSSNARRRVISINELYQKNSETGELEFRGEQVVTAAILEVSDPVEKRIYLTVGHGEMSLDDADPQHGLSELATYFNYRNIELASIDLSRYDSVPDWVDVLVIASPQAGFSDEDVEKLRFYLEKTNGSIILFLEPFRQHNLDDLLYDWGILCEDSIIIDPGSDFQTSSGNLILRRFAEHPITQSLVDNKLYVYSNRPRPVRLDPSAPRIAGVQRTALLGTSDTSWIETGFREEKIPSFTFGRDVAGPITLGVLSERRSAESLGLKLKGGKFIVYGDSSILSNNLFGFYGNRVLISNSFNWCLQRNHLLSIPPNRIKNYRLTISEADLGTLLIALLLLPIGVAVFGLIIRVIRR